MKNDFNVEEKQANSSKIFLIKQLVLSSLFLSSAIVFQLIEIPIYFFLSIDATLGILILSTFYLKKGNVILITIVTPLATFFGIGGGDIVGFLILETIYLSFIITFLSFSKRNVWIKILLGSIVSFISILIANIIIFYPAYYGFNYELLFGNGDFVIYFSYVLVFTTISSISRFIVSFLIFFIFKKTLKK